MTANAKAVAEVGEFYVPSAGISAEQRYAANGKKQKLNDVPSAGTEAE